MVRIGIIFAMSSLGRDNIILIGMPGVGKSTFGVVLAKILNYGFLDTDLLIQQQMGRTLQDIIDAEGSMGFINIENDALKRISCERTVISTGGSAVYSAEGMENLASQGHIVYLRTIPEELAAHLGNFTNRGITSLQGGTPDLDQLIAEREPLYEKYANVIVDTSGLSINGALDRMLRALKEADIGSEGTA